MYLPVVVAIVDVDMILVALFGKPNVTLASLRQHYKTVYANPFWPILILAFSRFVRNKKHKTLPTRHHHHQHHWHRHHQMLTMCSVERAFAWAVCHLFSMLCTYTVPNFRLVSIFLFFSVHIRSYSYNTRYSYSIQYE